MFLSLVTYSEQGGWGDLKWSKESYLKVRAAKSVSKEMYCDICGSHLFAQVTLVKVNPGLFKFFIMSKFAI